MMRVSSDNERVAHTQKNTRNDEYQSYYKSIHSGHPGKLPSTWHNAAVTIH